MDATDTGSKCGGNWKGIVCSYPSGLAGTEPTEQLFFYPLLINLLKQQFVVTHTFRQTVIPGSPGSWVTKTPSVTVFCLQTACPYIS